MLILPVRGCFADLAFAYQRNGFAATATDAGKGFYDAQPEVSNEPGGRGPP
jgi:hypothetical protein